MALVDCTIIVEPNNVAVSVAAAPTVQVSPAINEVQVQGAAGIRGPKGDKGEAVSTQSYEAGANLSGHRAVRISAGLAYYCDAANPAHLGKCIGITTGAVVAGEVATVQTIGPMTESSWTWAEGAVFVGTNGSLTQSLAGLAFIQQVGVALSATSIDINPQLSILIS